MTILLSALLVLGWVVANPPSVAAEGERHSGTVVSVDPAARSFVLQELIENGRLRRLQVRVPEGVAVVYSERLADEKVTRLDAPFADWRIDLDEVRPGDFIVVEGAARGGAATATGVVVTLRGDTAAGIPPAAAPGRPARP